MKRELTFKKSFPTKAHSLSLIRPRKERKLTFWRVYFCIKNKYLFEVYFYNFLVYFFLIFFFKYVTIFIEDMRRNSGYLMGKKLAAFGVTIWFILWQFGTIVLCNCFILIVWVAKRYIKKWWVRNWRTSFFETGEKSAFFSSKRRVKYHTKKTALFVTIREIMEWGKNNYVNLPRRAGK